MICPTCGQAAQGFERFCQNCGSDLTRAPASAPAAAPVPGAPAVAPPAAPAAPGELRGVGGWLLVFCIWITIFDPLMSLRLLTYLRYLSLNWFLIVPLLVTAFGLVTGIQLWMAKPEALILLRIFFGLVLAELVLSFVNFFRLMHESFGGIWVAFGWLRGILFLAGWFLYFRRSARVRNTYGANL